VDTQSERACAVFVVLVPRKNASRVARLVSSRSFLSSQGLERVRTFGVGRRVRARPANGRCCTCRLYRPFLVCTVQQRGKAGLLLLRRRSTPPCCFRMELILRQSASLSGPASRHFGRPLSDRGCHVQEQGACQRQQGSTVSTSTFFTALAY
jgi:hypothetical protein